MKINIEYNGDLLAIVIKDSYSKTGVSFFTPEDLSQQLAYMKHPSGTMIKPHVHNPVRREVHYTQEVLIIKRGILRVDFYDDNKICLGLDFIDRQKGVLCCLIYRINREIGLFCYDIKVFLIACGGS